MAEVIGHEVSHSKWNEKMHLYWGYLKGLFQWDEVAPFISKDEISQIMKYTEAIHHYVPAKVNYAEYYKNFAEVTARKEGQAVLRKHNELGRLLEKTFPDVDCRHYSNTQNFDDIDCQEDLFASIFDFDL